MCVGPCVTIPITGLSSSGEDYLFVAWLFISRVGEVKDRDAPEGLAGVF